MEAIYSDFATDWKYAGGCLLFLWYLCREFDLIMSLLHTLYYTMNYKFHQRAKFLSCYLIVIKKAYFNFSDLTPTFWISIGVIETEFCSYLCAYSNSPSTFLSNAMVDLFGNIFFQSQEHDAILHCAWFTHLKIVIIGGIPTANS